MADEVILLTVLIYDERPFWCLRNDTKRSTNEVRLPKALTKIELKNPLYQEEDFYIDKGSVFNDVAVESIFRWNDK
jgi:hypothetical protein